MPSTSLSSSPPSSSSSLSSSSLSTGATGATPGTGLSGEAGTSTFTAFLPSEVALSGDTTGVLSTLPGPGEAATDPGRGTGSRATGEKWKPSTMSCNSLPQILRAVRASASPFPTN